MEPSVSTSQRSGNESGRLIILILLMNVLALGTKNWWWPSWGSADFSLACLSMLVWMAIAGRYGYLRSKALPIYVAASVLLAALMGGLRSLSYLETLPGFIYASDLQTFSFLLMVLNIPILCTSHIFNQLLSHVSGHPPLTAPLATVLGCAGFALLLLLPYALGWQLSRGKKVTPSLRQASPGWDLHQARLSQGLRPLRAAGGP